MSPLPPTDEQLMWRVQMHDDAGGFALLVRRWETPIQRLCTRMLGDEHRAQDLTQEIFARLFARRKDYQPAARLSTFLWRIALNLCHDELRKIKRHGETPLDSGDDGDGGAEQFASPEPAPDEHAQRHEQAELVRRALARLSDPYREVLVLRHYQDLKFREIAEVLDIPEGTVKSRMAEALTQFARVLRADAAAAQTFSQPSPRIRSLTL